MESLKDSISEGLLHFSCLLQFFLELRQEQTVVLMVAFEGQSLISDFSCSLQFGTSDGRVKVSGSPGAEGLCIAGDRTGTRILIFLTGKGALLRITQVNAHP